MTQINRQYKDRLFKYIFGNAKNKAWTLSLYNAIHGTDYTDPDDIEFNTIENAVYMGMKNVLSYIIYFAMEMYEQQSSFNPNMPMRFFLYAGSLYEKYIASSNYYLYSSSLQKIPRPVCICFYNGTQEQPESQVLKLSDACEPLKEYAWVVDTIRRNQDNADNLESAINITLDDMPEDFVIRPFLIAHRAEVTDMFITEYDQEKVLEKGREEAKQEGREEGKAEGKEERNVEVASDMLKAGNQPVSFIAQISKLSETSVRKLASQMGITTL